MSIAKRIVTSPPPDAFAAAAHTVPASSPAQPARRRRRRAARLERTLVRRRGPWRRCGRDSWLVAGGRWPVADRIGVRMPPKLTQEELLMLMRFASPQRPLNILYRG